jgi:hypothetical protein
MPDKDMDVDLGHSLIEPGHFGDSPDNIIIIKNLVTPEDLKLIQKLLPTIEHWYNPSPNIFNDEGICIYDASYWWDRVVNTQILRDQYAELHDLVDKYNLLVKVAIEDKFNYKVFMRPPCVVRWLPGCLQEPHADKQLKDGTPNPFPTYDINSVIYWNDEFEGGQFYYEQHGIELEIEPGMAVAHPGDVHYLHGVKPITSGVRWTSPAFTTITDLGDTK